jgi:6,7-dimethyl-8-ribityllumazine synthase
MAKEFAGNYDGKGLKIGIVVSRFNELITKKLLEGALDCLQRHSVADDDIEIVWVPGAFEIPYACSKLLDSKKEYDAVICLGSVIRGETEHNRYISNEVVKSIASMSISEKIPVILGVITPDTLEQALERAGTKAGNKGFSSALSAIEMANLYKEI